MAVTGVPVVTVSPVAGSQLYVLPPLALNVVDAPLHMVAAPPLAVIVGRAFTEIALVAVAEQPDVVPVTV